MSDGHREPGNGSLLDELRMSNWLSEAHLMEQPHICSAGDNAGFRRTESSSHPAAHVLAPACRTPAGKSVRNSHPLLCPKCYISAMVTNLTHFVRAVSSSFTSVCSINWPEWINTKMQMHYLASAEPVLMHSQEKPSAAFYQPKEAFNNCGGCGHSLSQKVRDHCSEFSSPTALG